jgi:hypothetical protein
MKGVKKWEEALLADVTNDLITRYKHTNRWWLFQEEKELDKFLNWMYNSCEGESYAKA